MPSVAIVTACSEYGYALLRQCLASCDKCACNTKNSFQFTAFCYECNWSLSPEIKAFSREIDMEADLPLERIQIVQKDASKIDLKHTRLPDIAVYDDFARNYLDEFDYALFCHDDIHFGELDVFSRAVSILDNNRWNMVADIFLCCDDAISIRYRPHFIFVHKDKFRRANLSFANDYNLYSDDFQTTPPQWDGGAGLLFSQFSKQNKTSYVATNFVPESWVKHLRFDFCEMGIESYNITHPGTKDFQKVMQQSNRFVDQYLYGHD